MRIVIGLAFFAMWLLSIAIYGGIVVGVVYVAWHFAAKYW